MSYLIKLVRDRMPDMRGPGSTIFYAPVEVATHERLLRQKLIEEAAEYAIDPSVEELGDVYDVLAGLCHHVHGISVKQLVQRTAGKWNERGGFERGIGMFAEHAVGVCPVDGQPCSEQPRGPHCCEACPAYRSSGS